MTYVGTVPCCWLLPFVLTIGSSAQSATESACCLCLHHKCKQGFIMTCIVGQSECYAEILIYRSASWYAHCAKCWIFTIVKFELVCYHQFMKNNNIIIKRGRDLQGPEFLNSLMLGQITENFV